MTRWSRMAGVVACSALSALAQERPAADAPNVLFVITDQQFGDAMSCRMGDAYLRTPTMDGLAKEGMLFARAYSSNPLCMPYRNSVFSGLYPHQTGVTRNEDPANGFDPRKFVSLGVRFRNAGYDTGYSGKWHLCYNAKDPAAHGFEIVQASVGKNVDANTTAGAVQFLNRKRDRPFLLVASYLNPHNICEWARRLAGREQVLNCGEIGEPPPPDRLPPAPANLAPPVGEPDGMALMRRGYHASASFPVGGFTAEDWRRHRWGYYRMIEKVDAEIGALLAALRASGAAERTVVILTSDHGDCAGAHGFNQKTVFYEESARVPLIVAWKGRTKAGTSEALVNTGIDLMPTMLEFAGIPVPRELPGRSLAALAMGKDAGGWRDHIVIEDDMSQAGEVDGIVPRMEGRMVRTDRYKYCVFGAGQRRESLIDLRDDPGETKDLAGDPAHRDELLRHRALLEAFAREQNDATAAALIADGVPPRAFVAAPARTPRAAGKKRK